MKRILTAWAVALLALNLSAQGLPDFSAIEKYDVRHKTPTAKTSFDVLKYMGWGITNVMGDAEFVDNTSFGINREFFMNLFQFGLKPSPNNKISLGVDLNWHTYRLNDGLLWAPFDFPAGSPNEHFQRWLYTAPSYAVNGHVYPVSFNGTIKKSHLRLLSFNIPLDYTLTLGKLEATIGAAAEINAFGWTRFKGSAPEGVTADLNSLNQSGVKTNIVTFNVHAKLTLGDGIGIYFKYSPMPVLKDTYGPQFNSWSIGLML